MPGPSDSGVDARLLEVGEGRGFLKWPRAAVWAADERRSTPIKENKGGRHASVIRGTRLAVELTLASMQAEVFCYAVS